MEVAGDIAEAGDAGRVAVFEVEKVWLWGGSGVGDELPWSLGATVVQVEEGDGGEGFGVKGREGEGGAEDEELEHLNVRISRSESLEEFHMFRGWFGM